MRGNTITFVTTCSSSSSYLNMIELQNRCLTQAHSNVFIPPTLKGSYANDVTGAIDHDRLKKNLKMATDVYINIYSGFSCGDTVIHLNKGADSSNLQKLRLLLNILHNHSYIHLLPPFVEIEKYFMQLNSQQPTKKNFQQLRIRYLFKHLRYKHGFINFKKYTEFNTGSR